jgi:hypothetical protein
MYGPGSDNTAANWSQFPALSTIQGGSNVITTTGTLNAGSIVANQGLSVTHDAANGGQITTTGSTKLGLGTSGLANSIQIGVTGNVGIRKAPNVALDVDGQVSCTSLASGAAAFTGDATTHHINPITNNNYYCGDPLYRWANTYTQLLDVAGATTAGTINAGTISASNTLSVTNTVTGGIFNTLSGTMTMNGTSSKMATLQANGSYLLSIRTPAADGTYGLYSIQSEPDQIIQSLAGNNILLSYVGNDLYTRSANSATYSASWALLRLL